VLVHFELAIKMEADDDMIESRHTTVWRPWVQRFVDDVSPQLVETLDGRVSVVGWNVHAVF